MRKKTTPDLDSEESDPIVVPKLTTVSREMPIYEYFCEACDQIFERTQRITDPPLSECPECSASVKKLISRSSFRLKGTGWYETDFKNKGGSSSSPSPTAPSSSKATTETSTSESKSEKSSSTESKTTSETAVKTETKAKASDK